MERTEVLEVHIASYHDAAALPPGQGLTKRGGRIAAISQQRRLPKQHPSLYFNLPGWDSWHVGDVLPLRDLLLEPSGAWQHWGGGPLGPFRES